MATLVQYRRDLARRAGMLKEITTGVLYSGTYQGTASGADAGRRVISTDLASSDRAGTGPNMPAGSANYLWLYAPSTGEQRRVLANGYTSRATAASVLTGHSASADAYIVGYYVVDRAFSSTLSANITVEAINTFPVLTQEQLPGLHWAINEALGVMHWPMKIAITGVSNKLRYDISSTMPWLKQSSQIIRIFSPEDDTDTGPEPMQGQFWLEPDGEKMYLHIPQGVDTGDTFSVQVKRPTNTWIKSSGTWASSTVGLVNETDEALPTVDHLSAVAYAILADHMAKKGPKPQAEEWKAEAESAAEIARPYLNSQLEPMAHKRDWGYRVPRHPFGKAWRSTLSTRRWP